MNSRYRKQIGRRDGKWKGTGSGVWDCPSPASEEQQGSPHREHISDSEMVTGQFTRAGGTV